jgi:hypothetical protein
MTTKICPNLQFLHHRMPVIFSKEEALKWLDPFQSFADLRPLIVSKKDGYKVYPVSDFVNRTQNDGPKCIEPIKIPRQLPFSFKSNKSPVHDAIDLEIKPDLHQTPIKRKAESEQTKSTLQKKTTTSPSTPKRQTTIHQFFSPKK